jgi:protein AATF/BFR2
MSTHRLTLAQQLKQLESDDPTSNPLFNPDNDDSALDGLSRPAEGVHREHYLDVGPSRLRNEMGGMGGLGGAEQTLRSEKYGGKVTGRMKIFDDDEDEEEGRDGVDGEEEDEEDEEEEGDKEGEEDDEEEEDEEQSDGDEDEEDEENEDEEDEEDEEDGEEESAPPRTRPGSSKTLDPIAALKDSRLKDIEKGRGIRRQRVRRRVHLLGVPFHSALCPPAPPPIVHLSLCQR